MSAELQGLEQKALQCIQNHKDPDKAFWSELSNDLLLGQQGNQKLQPAEMKAYKQFVSSEVNKKFRLDYQILGVDEKSKGLIYYNKHDNEIVRTAAQGSPDPGSPAHEVPDWKIRPDCRYIDLGQPGAEDFVRGGGSAKATDLITTAIDIEEAELNTDFLKSHTLPTKIYKDIILAKGNAESPADFAAFSASVMISMEMDRKEKRKIEPITIVTVDGSNQEVVLAEPDGKIRRYNREGLPDLVITTTSVENITR